MLSLLHATLSIAFVSPPSGLLPASKATTLASVPHERQLLHQPTLLTSSSGSCRLSNVRMELPNIDGTGAFRNVQEYPCDLEIKIIGLNEGAFVSDMRTLCAEITGQDEEDVPVRWRDNGKYRSITVKLHFKDADTVYAVYAAIDGDPRVKYKL